MNTISIIVLCIVAGGGGILIGYLAGILYAANRQEKASKIRYPTYKVGRGSLNPIGSHDTNPFIRM
jgi:hypothetical protein